LDSARRGRELLLYDGAMSSRWDKAKVMATIRRLKRAGEAISYAHVHRINAALSGAAVYHFGTYRAAVIAAGIDYDRRVRKQQHWSKELVIKAIRRRSRARQDLSPGYLVIHEKRLYLAACTHFGSYRKAVMAAGIDYQKKVLRPPGLRWPERKVLAEIKRQQRLGKDLAHNAMRSRNESLVFAASRRFGTYAAAVEAAGINYQSVKAVRRWNRQRVIEALKKLNKASKDLSTTALKRSNDSLYEAARRHLGGYDKALGAAGVQFSSVRRVEQWNKEKVIRQLERRYRAGKALASKTMRVESSKLLAAAERSFGSYATAVRAAGIDYDLVMAKKPSWTAGAVIQAIRARSAAGRRLNHRVTKREDGSLLNAAVYRFGGWREAVAAAGIDYRRVLDQWDKEKVLRELKELAASGQEMSRAAVCRTRRALVVAAQRHAGGYDQALEQAGIELPAKPLRMRAKPTHQSGVAAGAAGHWTEQSVLRTLRELYREGTRDLRHRAMKRSHHSLFWAATELYGSYVNAVWAAGIDYETIAKEGLERERNRRRARSRRDPKTFR
jgi:hypothetical protein